MFSRALRGRGAAENPPNRFERIEHEPDPEAPEDERPSPRTEFYRDASRSIIATNDSPDIPYEASVNPYRGCEHGCPFCYARPTHEYLGLSAGLDFETKIFVKDRAPELLREALSSRRWKPKHLAMSGVTDPYQPIERKLRLTRGCLEVLADFRNPVCVTTKNALVGRDVDILGELARHRAAAVFVTVATLDGELSRVLEPRASAPRARLEAVRALAAAGVPTGVMVAPVIPGLTDHEAPAILEAAAGAGATSAGMVLLRLPHGVAGIFEAWLERHAPGRKEKVLDQLRAAHGGKLYDSRFGRRLRGEGTLAEHMHALFAAARRRAGLDGWEDSLSTGAFRRVCGPQLELF